MPGKTTPKNIEAHVLDVLRASPIPLCTLEIQRRLKGSFEVRKIASCIAHLSVKMLINRTGEMTTSKGRYGLYQIAKAPKAQAAYVWTPLKPMRATVIPVRASGRIAPDVCDGVAVSMDSRVEYQRRAA
jgi:hypothetical protein